VPLGGFHVLMSYLGTGKAVSHALRGHFLVEFALTTVLMKQIMNFDAVSETWRTVNFAMDDIDNLDVLYIDVIEGRRAVNAIGESESFQKLQELLMNLKLHLSQTSRTAKLWLQYLTVVQTMKLFIRAERTCDWHLHLYSLSLYVAIVCCHGA